MDETHVRVKDKWFYLYRTIDLRLSRNRNKRAAERLFLKAIGNSRMPKKVTIDKSGANKAALKSINDGLLPTDDFEIWQCKYLNNIIESAYRLIKRITKAMMGFQAFHSASATLLGTELHHMLRKRQPIDAANMTVLDNFMRSQPNCDEWKCVRENFFEGGHKFAAEPMNGVNMTEFMHFYAKCAGAQNASPRKV